MKKQLMILLTIVMVLGMTAIPEAGATSLCKFPFGQNGRFDIMYDQQLYDNDYFTSSYPNGGIKFSMFLGSFSTAQERDELADKIEKVVLLNKTTGSVYTIKKPVKYIYTDHYDAEFILHLGNKHMVLGEWVIRVFYELDKYRATFQITEDMFEQYVPIPVKPQVLSPVDGTFEIVAPITNGYVYRLRVFDEAGNLITDDDMTIDGDMVRHTYPASLMGKWACIETRIYGTGWPVLMYWGQPETCKSAGMIDGGGSRSAIWFKTNVLE